MKKGLLILALALGVFSTSAFAAEKKAPKPAPQMAGFGMVAPTHMCTLDYRGCLNRCGATGGAGCELECTSDCNVCSLDFGEESTDVCRK